MPFLFVFIWLFALAAVSRLLRLLYESENAPGSDLTDYIAVAGVEMAMIAMFLCIARKYFARGLRGFGLDLRTIWTDLRTAVLNYITVFPLVILSVFLVMWAGTRIVGEDFQIQQNEGLSVLAQSSGPQICFLIISFVLIVPIFEEILYRGLFQSALRRLAPNPWIAIIAASVIFMLMHPWTHWPAIFFLSCCMGYTYERSGSLIRPILVHMIFNGINVTGMLLSKGF